MIRKSIGVLIFILFIGVILGGCPKKTVVKEEPSLKKAEEMTPERARAERAKAEQAAKEAREKEMARMKEEEQKAAASKEFEKSLVGQKTPGINGTVFESKLLKDIHFDFDKYSIRPRDAEILKDNAAVLKKFPKVKIQVEGHCDERGTLEYNLALGQRRAHSTKMYLSYLGISEDRISTISYGEERPFDPDHDEEAWTKNRRAHFVILSK